MCAGSEFVSALDSTIETQNRVRCRIRESSGWMRLGYPALVRSSRVLRSMLCVSSKVLRSGVSAMRSMFDVGSVGDVFDVVRECCGLPRGSIVGSSKVRIAREFVDASGPASCHFRAGFSRRAHARACIQTRMCKHSIESVVYTSFGLYTIRLTTLAM